jgi:hypothetical protein
MNKDRSRLVRWGLIALAAFVACGESLIDDPSFDLWCGKSLCQPWEVQGTVTRVKTWHRSDFGVSLEDGAVMTQLSTKKRVDCIEFEVIADVTAGADVRLEMDFGDDGSSEYEQQIPESHWAKIRYDVAAPTWYERVRFILRKRGHGRAVLAEIRASAGVCYGPALPSTNRPNGVQCSEPSQCASGVCGAAGSANGVVIACGECSPSEPCAGDALCSLVRGEDGVYPACVPPGQTQSGTLCVQDIECESGHCAPPIPGSLATCAECTGDDECTVDEVCGVGINERGAVRTCQPRHTRELGDICASDAECKSDVCGELGCSECNDLNACPDHTVCASIQGGLFGEPLVGARLCDGGNHTRLAGEACVRDDDCVAGQCDLPDPTCYRCEGERCAEMTHDKCTGGLRRLAGVCR